MEPLDLRVTKDAVMVRVRVKPRAKRARVGGVRGGALEVAVTAPPVDGEANAAVIEALANALGVPKRAVTLVRGASSRDKTFRIESVTAEQVAALASSGS
jgi:uncharacterized protein (TIGR00251 family)